MTACGERNSMAVKLYRVYRMKFYLNMRPYIIINGTKGEIHPHTWEFALDIKFGRSSFVEFKTFENGISEFLERYQNKILNEIEPFDAVLPTIENVTDFFSEEFCRIIYDIGGMLTSVEASETPTRSYIVNISEMEEHEMMNKKTDDRIMSDVMDVVLDEIVKGK